MSQKTIVIIGVMFLASCLLAACAGVQFSDLVRVQTPTGIQQSTGQPSSLTLTQARHEYQVVLDRTVADLTAWRGNIERGEQFAAILSQIALQQLNELGPTIAGLPVLGPLAPAIFGAIGLLIRRPGDVPAVELRKEKEQSFNKGNDEGRRDAIELLQSLGLSIPAAIAQQVLAPPPPGGASGPSEATPPHAG